MKAAGTSPSPSPSHAKIAPPQQPRSSTTRSQTQREKFEILDFTTLERDDFCFFPIDLLQSREKREGFMTSQNFILQVCRAEHLPKMDTFGSCDPYCVVEYGSQQKTTSVKNGEYDPVWRENFRLWYQEKTDLVVKLYDHDLVGSHDEIGEVVISANLLSQILTKSENKEIEMKVTKKKKIIVGHDSNHSLIALLFSSKHFSALDEIFNNSKEFDLQHMQGDTMVSAGRIQMTMAIRSEDSNLCFDQKYSFLPSLRLSLKNLSSADLEDDVIAADNEEAFNDNSGVVRLHVARLKSLVNVAKDHSHLKLVFTTATESLPASQDQNSQSVDFFVTGRSPTEAFPVTFTISIRTEDGLNNHTLTTTLRNDRDFVSSASFTSGGGEEITLHVLNLQTRAKIAEFSLNTQDKKSSCIIDEIFCFDLPSPALIKPRQTIRVVALPAGNASTKEITISPDQLGLVLQETQTLRTSLSSKFLYVKLIVEKKTERRSFLSRQQETSHEITLASARLQLNRFPLFQTVHGWCQLHRHGSTQASDVLVHLLSCRGLKSPRSHHSQTRCVVRLVISSQTPSPSQEMETLEMKGSNPRFDQTFVFHNIRHIHKQDLQQDKTHCHGLDAFLQVMVFHSSKSRMIISTGKKGGK
eukprot:768459-Hanusia_phi.AAC.9